MDDDVDQSMSSGDAVGDSKMREIDTKHVLNY
eukprot:CAMPEP_0170473996 /NCGR_PEP_ID=MMETSP0123-20130129/15834_1 /TAXON_ID=182087 /ORGANISM="Favella ehrenbergii, Strain Fehren 1" /LENGTH=31 /DNA_ID= /DNA_START= /DNA_END= /DNA_ORIENTATION=